MLVYTYYGTQKKNTKFGNIYIYRQITKNVFFLFVYHRIKRISIYPYYDKPYISFNFEKYNTIQLLSNLVVLRQYACLYISVYNKKTQNLVTSIYISKLPKMCFFCCTPFSALSIYQRIYDLISYMLLVLYCMLFHL